MGITLANNAHTTLSADASSIDTTIYVDDIDSFPTLGTGDYFYLTLERTSGAQEIVKVTQINSSSFIVERGQENTIPISFSIGSMAKLNMTVQNITDLILTGSNIDDSAYSSDWNGDIDDAPSRNAVYDKFVTVDAALAGYTASDVLTKLLTVDGTGSLLDADLLDGYEATAFAQLSGASFTGDVTVGGGDLVVGSTKYAGIANLTLKYDNSVGYSGQLLWVRDGTTMWYAQSGSSGSWGLRNNGLGTDAINFASATNNATFTGTVTVPDDAYAAGWDGSLTVPTKNAVYDKIETLSSAISAVVSDTAYGAGWDSDTTVAPSKNAVYDKINSLAQANIIGLTTADSPSLTGGTITGGIFNIGSKLFAGDAALRIMYGPSSGGPNTGGVYWLEDAVNKWIAIARASTGAWALRNSTLSTDALLFASATNNATFTGTVTVPDDAYAAGWDGNLTVPTKNAVYDKIQSLATLADGDKGDITVSASGATWTIDNNAVTLAKMATMATDSILGRATAATGNVEVLTALPFAFTGDVTRAADSNAQTIANDAVTYAKMQNVSAQYKILGRSTAGAGDVEELSTSANMVSLIASADYSTARTNLGLAIGTNVQAYSAILAALAASSNITGTITVSTSAPSGGSSGDVWYERAA